jgi:phage antirepressor YoqD-like protein
MLSSVLKEAANSQDFVSELIGKLQAESGKVEALTALSEELAPKAMYCDIILQSKNAVPVSVIAKDYGMSAAAFNILLHNLRIQYKAAGIWLPYQQYAGKGYTKTRTYIISETASAIHTYWTQKGRRFLYEKLKSRGIVPSAESCKQIIG